LLGDGSNTAAKLGQIEIERCAALERSIGARVRFRLDRHDAYSFRLTGLELVMFSHG
jgi:L-alanine-DL-glutamate epimerase-like enolase superfamily enzyme